MGSNSSLAWFVDFDGTLINLDLGARFSDWIFASGRVSKLAPIIRILGAPLNYALRKLERGQLIRAWSWGLTDPEVQAVISDFLVLIKPEIVLNKPLLERLRINDGSKKILLTGCPQELVTAFLSQFGINEFDEVVGMTVFHNVIIKRHPFGRSKIGHTRGYGPFIAVGDSWQDRFILQLATEAIIVPRVERLEKLAIRSGWEFLPKGAILWG